MVRFALACCLLVGLAAAQQYPFNEDPLAPSLNSNKVFIDVDDVKDISGVWQGINTVFHSYMRSPELYDGVTPYNMSCEAAQGGGFDYDNMIKNPRAFTIEADPERMEDGSLGFLVDSRYGTTTRAAILDYTDSRLSLNDGTCRHWRPYLDWEIAKTIMVRRQRFYYYPGEAGTPVQVTSDHHEELCQYGGCYFRGPHVYGDRAAQGDCRRCQTTMGVPINEVDHPACMEGKFTFGGVERDGIVFDAVSYYMCTAGPCLDLPFTLPRYVQTQGYIPDEPLNESGEESDGTGDSGK